MTLDSSLIQILTTVAGSVAAVYAGLPWLLGKHSAAATTLQTVATVCDKVVAALEQTQGAASGAQKKALALDLVNTVLAAMHITVPAPFIDAAVEAAVLGLSALQSSSPPPAASPPPATRPPATLYTYDAMTPVDTPPGASTITSGPSDPSGQGTGPSG